MAKNFSVAWLSQSSHSSTTQQGNVVSLDVLQPYGSCTALPTQNQLEEATQTSSEVDSLLQDTKDVKIKAPSSPTNSCGYASGSESDVCEDSEGEAGPNRRVRTKFTSYQISRLEKTFNKHKYLGASQRKKIAEKLRLSETQVKTWFQNRRMKLKREVQDTRVDFFSPTLVPPLMFPPAQSFQHHGLSGQHLSLQLYQQQLHQQRLSLLTQQSNLHPYLPQALTETFIFH